MGNTLHTYEHLVHVESWNLAQAWEVVENLRWKQATLFVPRSLFEQLMGNRNERTIQVWECLDADFDGKVDTFEVLSTIILWSSTTMEEKSRLLFTCFDFNRKGALRFPELAFMLTTVSRVLQCFMDLDTEFRAPADLKQHASSAFKDAKAEELSEEAFQAWFESADVAKQLTEFLNTHTAGQLPDAAEAPVQKGVRLREYRVEELLRRVEGLKNKLTTVNAENLERGDVQQQQFEVLRKRVQALLSKLELAGETLQKELIELGMSMRQTVAASGPSALLEPSTKIRHDQLLAEVALLEKQAQEECGEASDLLQQMWELTFGSETEGRLPSPPLAEVPEPEEPGLVDKARAERIARNRVIDRKVRAQKGIKVLQSNTQQIARHRPKLVVAFADYTPSAAVTAKMLALQAGDEVMATMRETGGWWWGRKVKTHEEGWFPPTYVDLQEEGA